MEIAFFVILVCLVLSLFLNVKIYNDFKNLSIENKKIKKEKQKVEKFKEDLISINIGDKVIYPNCSLTYDKGGDNEHDFCVTYELIVTDVTRDKVKVNAIDFTTTDNKINNDQSKKQGIINFIMDKWVDKSRVELIIDESHKRNLKLEKLGIK
jgi:hypothetical protein